MLIQIISYTYASLEPQDERVQRERSEHGKGVEGKVIGA